jgi:hypothetical protein
MVSVIGVVQTSLIHEDDESEEESNSSEHGVGKDIEDIYRE